MKKVTQWLRTNTSQIEFIINLTKDQRWAAMVEHDQPAVIHDRLQWAWNLQLKGLNQEEAKNKFFDLKVDQLTITHALSKMLDSSGSKLFKVGSELTYMNGDTALKTTITAISVDFNCPYGGEFPVHLEHSADEDKTGLWVNAFGESIDGQHFK